MKQYLNIDLSAGFPVGQGIQYECLDCTECSPSLVTLDWVCNCGNIKLSGNQETPVLTHLDRVRIFQDIPE